MRSDHQRSGLQQTCATPTPARDSVRRAAHRLQELAQQASALDHRISTLQEGAPSFAPPSDHQSTKVLLEQGARLAWWEHIQQSEAHQRWLASAEREELQQRQAQLDAVEAESAWLRQCIQRAERWSASVGGRAAGWTLDTWTDAPGHASDPTHAPFRARIRSEAISWLRALVTGEQCSPVVVIAARGTGAGKTHLACAMGRELAFRGRSVQMHNVPRMFARVRGSFDGDQRSTLMDDAARCDVLILDDLGRHRGSAWEVEQLYSLLDAREMAAAPTIVTTNVQLSHADADSWRRAVGGTGYQPSQSWEVEAAASRLQGGAELLACVSLARTDTGARSVVEWPDIRGVR